MRMQHLRSRATSIIRAHPRLSIACAITLLLCVVVCMHSWYMSRNPAHFTTLQPPVLPAPKPARAVAFSEGCMTARCHTSLQDSPLVHAPLSAGACEACHAPDTGGHVFPLRRPRSQLCSQCHDTSLDGHFQHIAISPDGCLSCHDPHGSKSRHLLTANSQSQSCEECHPRTDGSVHHAPYASQRCDLCHNIHSSQSSRLLAKDSVVESCNMCHEQATRAIATSTHSHAGVQGECTNCHSAHSSPFPGLLKEPLRESCVRCHSDVGGTLASATVIHDPVLQGTQCIHCHAPHGSDSVAMLLSSEESLCLSCHNTRVIAADGRAIPAMAPLPATPDSTHRACSGCHSVHGGTHKSLLAAASSTTPRGPYDRSNYALCFSCHDPILGESAAGTLFRDGDRNLHEVHLRNGDQSRGCAACHAVHAVNAPRQIASSVRFEGSNWSMPLQFSLTPEGGKCGSSCHEPLSYSRRPRQAGSENQGAKP